MSPRSIYLRKQADKCQRHATALTDPATQAALRRLATKYIVEAAKIETHEKRAGPLPPSALHDPV